MPRGKYKTKVGTVVSDKMNKTVVVDVIQIKMDPRYKKGVKRNTRFKAHDENEQCNVGDKVLILETRPYSKSKRWRVSKIIERAIQIDVEADTGIPGGESQ